MTKDVLITISGIQTIDGEVNDPIETVTPGEYYFRNGKHYILYDEVQEGVPGVTKCMIKIGEDAVDVSERQKDTHFLSDTVWKHDAWF